MNSPDLPEINYKSFSATRDSIQLYAQLLSKIKSKFLPHQKNWEEFSLNTSANGFTTGALPVATLKGIEALEIKINLFEHMLKLSFGKNSDEINLHQYNITSFTGLLTDKLAGYGIKNINPEKNFYTEDKLVYNDNDAIKLFEMFRYIYFMLLDLRGKTLLETGNVNFWPHHFDTALLVFSGRLINGRNKLNRDDSREQMNFGFSSGDATIGQPYFYITSYPLNKKLLDYDIPVYAFRQKENWNGIVITYSEMLKMQNPANSLINFMLNMLNANFKKIDGNI